MEDGSKRRIYEDWILSCWTILNYENLWIFSFGEGEGEGGPEIWVSPMIQLQQLKNTGVACMQCTKICMGSMHCTKVSEQWRCSDLGWRHIYASVCGVGEWGSGVVGLFMWVNTKRWGSWKLQVCHGVRQQTKWHKCGCLASPFEEKWVAFMAPQFPLDVLLDASSKTPPFPSKLWWVPLHQFPLHLLPPKSVKMRRKIIHYSSGLLETCVFNGSSPSSTIKLYGTPPSTPTVKPPLLLLIFLTSHASAFSLWPTSFWHQSILSPSLCLHPIPCALLGHILEEECTYINTYTSLPTPIYMSMA